MSGEHASAPIDLAREPEFVLAGVRVRPATLEVLGESGREVLEPRVMQVLVALARRAGDVVSRDELIARCWDGRIVGDDAINASVAKVRRAGERSAAYRIETIPRVGYRLSATQVTQAPPVPARASKPSIAILPFANLSNDAEQDYFADGMVEEIAAALARFRNLFVIGSGSSFALKGQALTAQEAARTLGVRYVLDGSVRKASNRVRITAKLLDASDGAQIWTDRFEDTLDDVFALQDRVALAAAGAIEPSVVVAEMARVARHPVRDLNSYDLYLRGAAAMRAQNPQGWREAQSCLERAVELDPDFGLAWSSLGACHLAFVLSGLSGAEGAAFHVERARRARRKALRTAGDDSTVLASAALQVAELDRDLEGAVDLMERALALNPGSSMVWMYSGHVRWRTGEIDLAAEYYETAMRLDPIGAYGRRSAAYLAAPRFLQGRYGEAITLAKRYLQHQENAQGYGVLAACYARLGDQNAARQALARWRELSPRSLEEYLRATIRNPTHLQAWLDALAIIEAD